MSANFYNAPLTANNLQKPCIYLAGSFGYGSPMEDAAYWAIEQVLPLGRQQIPDIHFYIVGSDSDKVLSEISDPGITITGRLPSVLPYLCLGSVAIVPLRFESGTRFKILEAGACNISVVYPPLGSEWLPVTHGVVISLFHALGYQTTHEDLGATFTTAKTHLLLGVIFIFDCGYSPC